MSDTKSFWTSLPGILSGIAAIITAVGGILFGLYNIGEIGPQEQNGKVSVLPTVTTSKKMTEVEVKARPDVGIWTDTGVTIEPDNTTIIRYLRGQWKPNPYWGPTDGAGDSRYIAQSNYLCPDYPEGALVGKVGGDAQRGGSRVFEVGNLIKVPKGLSGTLWLSVNDCTTGEGDCFNDNHGSLIIQIETDQPQ